jgi:hypothetical protein
MSDHISSFNPHRDDDQHQLNRIEQILRDILVQLKLNRFIDYHEFKYGEWETYHSNILSELLQDED